MNPAILTPRDGLTRLQKPGAAFTLTETLIAVGVFSLVVIGVVSANLFGLRMYQMTDTKLTASDAPRKAIGKLTDDIRNCKNTYVGDVSNTTFLAVTDGQLQVGSGVIIYPTTNTNNFIIYFLNSADGTFRRTTSAGGSTTVLARSITNSILFRAQDYRGTILTNNQHNRVIYVDLECYQTNRLGLAPDYYKTETAVTRRAL